MTDRLAEIEQRAADYIEAWAKRWDIPYPLQLVEHDLPWLLARVRELEKDKARLDHVLTFPGGPYDGYRSRDEIDRDMANDG